MSRDDRTLAGYGFAVFSRSTAFHVATVARYLTLDTEARYIVYVHHPSTDPILTDGIRAAAHGRDFRPVAWAEYGDPTNVRAVGALPPENLVFVSADHHLSVHDRLDPRRAYIRRKGARKKIALDSMPYKALPWRVYFPFAFFDTGLLGYHHSYAIEQDYERYLDGGLTENPCDATRLAAKTWKAAIVDGEPYFGQRPKTRVLKASEKHQTEYAKVRDGLFDSEKTITSVKSKLSAWITERYPERDIPLDLKHVYPNLVTITRTDLLFDRWLGDEIAGLMKHTDELLGLYAWHQMEADE